MAPVAKKIEDAKIKLPDGNMHYQKLGSGPPLVLIHNMMTSVWSWSKVLEPLAEKYTVYTPETMGQGDSDKPAWDYTIEDYANSFVNFMKAKGIGKTRLIGNAVGAAISVQIAASHPEMIEKLVLAGCPCREAEDRQQYLVKRDAMFDKDGNCLPRGAEEIRETYAHVTPELVAKFNEERAKTGIWALKGWTANNNFIIIPQLQKIKAPTLIIFGEKDRLRKKEHDLQNYIKGSKLVIIPDAAHFPQVDNPKAFLETVLPFLG